MPDFCVDRDLQGKTSSMFFPEGPVLHSFV